MPYRRRMCGRFTQQRPTSEIARIFEAEDLADDPGGHFNVAPTDEAAVVVQRDERRAVVRYRWGLVPSWAAPRQASRAFNARAETLATSGLFRDAFRRRRCLVPVDGFYEWRRAEDGKRQPAAHPRPGGPAARAGRPLDGPPRRRDRRVDPLVHDRDDPAERVHGPDPRPDAGRRAARGLGDLARPDAARARRAARAPGAARRRAAVAYAVPPLVNNVRNDGPGADRACRGRARRSRPCSEPSADVGRRRGPLVRGLPVPDRRAERPAPGRARRRAPPRRRRRRCRRRRPRRRPGRRARSTPAGGRRAPTHRARGAGRRGRPRTPPRRGRPAAPTRGRRR